MGQHSIGYKIQELDSKGKRVPEERKGSGQDYIYALFPPDPGSKAEKNRQKKKILLKRPDGTPKPAREFQFYPKSSGGGQKSPASIAKSIREAVDALAKEMGFSSEVHAMDSLAGEQKEKRRISYAFEVFIEHYKSTPTKRTLKPRDPKSVAELQTAMMHYLSIFGDHYIDDFPRNVAKDFQLKMAMIPKRKGSSKMLSPMTIRKHAIGLHQFFDHLSEHGWISGRPVKFDMPSTREAPAPRKWKPGSQDKVTKRIVGLLEKAKTKPGKKNRRISEAENYHNHLRGWMINTHIGLRLAEIQSLRIENIDLDTGHVMIPGSVDLDGGLDNKGNPFRVVCNSKSGRNERSPIPKPCWNFLKQDLEESGRTEGWYLARPDGSCAYKTPEALGKVFERHQKAVGVFGEAKRSHGARVTIGTEMGKENIYFAQQMLRHRDVKTTLASYVAETPDEVREAIDKVSEGFQKPEDFKSRNDEKVM